MSAKLDIITLRGLSAEGIHGVFEFEHAAPQPFVIDIALWVDTTDAITSDDIADTVSYADVANDVVSVVEGPSAHLIETLAQRISDVLLANPRVEGVEVTVHKPKAPIDQEFTDIAITVRRGNTPGTILRIRDIHVVDGKVAPEADEPLVSFGGPDEASALPSASPTSSVSLQGIEPPSPPAARHALMVEQLPQDEAQSPGQTASPDSEASLPFVLALGGNVGDVPVTLAEAVSHLIDITQVQIDDVSPLLRTHAVLAPGQAPQPDHWNAVVIGHTTLSPHDFFAHTSGIETALGRVRHEHWGPRRIDIDIIAMGDRRIDDEILTIPHPRAHLRAFVLAPWVLSDPDAVLPGHGRIEDLLATTEDIHGIIDAVDDWLESPEGIQAESDALVASEKNASDTSVSGSKAEDSAVSVSAALADPVEDERSHSDSTRDRAEETEAGASEQIRSITELTRPLVIPPIAVPQIAQPLSVSRLDRLDPSSKASLQPEQGADLLWHKVWNSWAQTPIDPHEIPAPQQTMEEALTPSPIEEEPAGPAPKVSAPLPSSPDKTAADPMVPAQTMAEQTVEQTVPPRDEDAVGSRSVSSQSTIAQPLPFQQVLVDDGVLEENPGQRPMRWAPVQTYDASHEAPRHQVAGEFGTRMVPHPDIPLSAPVADEAAARAELARIEAERLAETLQDERPQDEKESRELRVREEGEREMQEAAHAQEEAIRVEVARLEVERKEAAARAAAEREASLPPLPKRRAQFAPLRADAPRADGHGDAAERPLPQWDFSSTQVNIVDDSVDNVGAPTVQPSVLVPDLPEGTPTGAVGETPGQTGMLNRVTMRPTATGMIPVVKRDSLHS